VADRLTSPPPIARLRAIAPEIHLLPAGAVLWRITFRAGAHPSPWNGFRTFGPTNARFDHHPAPARRHRKRAILYASDSGPTSIAEVFQQTRVVDRFADTPALAAFQLIRDLQLLDLTGAWPTRAGASMAIHSGSRGKARAWSRAIYAAYPDVEGLRYASSMNANQPAFALYERARSSLPPAAALDVLLATPALAAPLAAAAIQLGYALV
jgi:RES domain